MAEPRATSCSPILFFFLHVCTAWPIGVVGLAHTSSLVKAGVPVQHTATIIAASTLAFTLEFAWAPLVDSSFTRRAWYLGGAVVMCACLAVLLVAPWNLAWVPALTALAFASTLGIGVAFAAATVLIVQGSISLLAMLVGTSLGTVARDTPWIIQMTAAGGAVIVGISLLLLDLKQIRVANFIPAIFIAPLITVALELLKIQLP